MRVVSLVPSLTETLLRAGVTVVGRTRYCVHPAALVNEIAVVGGTKDWNAPSLVDLKADLILLDREENPVWMGAQAPVAPHVFHAQSIANLATEMEQLADRLQNSELRAQADRWRRVDAEPALTFQTERVPGEQRRRGDWTRVRRICPVIWRKPWMSLGPSTFAGSVFAKLGFELTGEERYPTFGIEELADDVALVFLTEPYPFARKWDEFTNLDRPQALVDGEAITWFGIRALEFLERELEIS